MNISSSSSGTLPSSWKSKQQSQKVSNKIPMYLSLALILVLLAIGGTVWAVMGNKDKKDSNSNDSSSSSTSTSSSSSSETDNTSSSSSSSEESSSTSSSSSSSSNSAGDVELEETVVEYEGDIAAQASVGFKKCTNSTCTHYLLPNAKKNIFPLLDPGSMYMISAEQLIEEDSAAGNQYFTMDGEIKIYIQATFKEEMTDVGETEADKAKTFLVFDTIVASGVEHSYTEHLLLNDELLSIFPFLNNIQPGQKVKIYVSSLKNLGNAAGNHYNELGGSIEIGLI